MTANQKGLGFFTRLLDDVGPAERYALAAEQIATAERFGYDSAWIAQHHAHRDEAGLPSPLVFLAPLAAQTSRIRLGTGIITLPMEEPIRVAEDAVVLDLMSNGRVELGLGTGGAPAAFEAFGHDHKARSDIYARYKATLRNTLSGGKLPGGNSIYPAASDLADRIWQATFSVAGGERAGADGDGLLLSRTQPRPADKVGAPLADLQNPIIDAYLAALPEGRVPRILASRSVFVADSRDEARRLAEKGLRRVEKHFVSTGHHFTGDTLDDLIQSLDTHVGTVDEVIESLSADTTLQRATDIAVQVHSVDPPHEYILRSIELFATRVAPALGWVRPVPTKLAAAG